MRALLAAAVLITLPGCTRLVEKPARADAGDVGRLATVGLTTVYRIRDPETGVVCYVSSSGYGNGIDCVEPPRP